MGQGQHARKSSVGGVRLWVIGVAIVALAVAAAGFVLIPRAHTPAAATTSTPPPVLRVLSTAPTGANVDSGSVISVQFSTNLAPGSPMPTLSPPVAGQWAALSPKLLQYQATAPLVPGTQETITVPDGAHGVVGSRGQHLRAPFTSFLHRCPGLHAPTAADVGRARLPPPQLHCGVAPRRRPPRKATPRSARSPGAGPTSPSP